MLRSTSSTHLAIIRGHSKVMLWESGQWFLGAIFWSAVAVIETCEYGILKMGEFPPSQYSCDANIMDRTAVHTLRGHTSTVRCLKMSDARTAISGSRDTTLRVWDLERGACKHVLVGHQASVRCLEIYGDICVSGSYDTTAKIWSISTGKCLRTLTGHFSQIYAIAFDGKKIATGSLDTSVRIWDPTDG
jgi:WD40 repeat protein